MLGPIHLFFMGTVQWMFIWGRPSSTVYHFGLLKPEGFNRVFPFGTVVLSYVLPLSGVERPCVFLGLGLVCPKMSWSWSRWVLLHRDSLLCPIPRRCGRGCEIDHWAEAMWLPWGFHPVWGVCVPGTPSRAARHPVGPHTAFPSPLSSICWWLRLLPDGTAGDWMISELLKANREQHTSSSMLIKDELSANKWLRGERRRKLLNSLLVWLGCLLRLWIVKAPVNER